MKLDRARLKASLARRDMYQYQLAGRLGVTETYLSKVLRGRTKPSAELLTKISRVLRSN
jgi:transcriptional regulator with XRE-family HTH domain